MTRQRRVILETLRGLQTHPSADELHRLVRRKLPHVSLATVYRNLDLLVQSGEALRLAGAGGASHFDGRAAPHYHIRCVSCGCVRDAWIDPPAGLDAAAERATDFEVIGHRLEFLGRCARCRDANRRKQTSTPSRRPSACTK